MLEYTRNGVERKFPYCDYEIYPESRWNYAFADEDHCANWDYHDEWTGDSYQNVTGTDYKYTSDIVIQRG